mmetsp:Transcript_22231/g.32342  ORF Transcript_22231/g.32342 Transcript_22231/m.32342 type:complete len:333 (+) Transcript_22231:51-1049(+)
MNWKTLFLQFFISANHTYASNHSIHCDSNAQVYSGYTDYFNGMKKIYQNIEDGTCIPVHRECGWPKQTSNLPQYVLVVGLEGSAHHFWTKLLNTPIYDCVWINARHYRRDIGDGVPRRTPEELRSGIQEQLALRVKEHPPACKKILDSEDSFPTGAIRRPGRLFMHPDIINVQHLDGDILNVKYLLILRNTSDTVMSAMRRDFVSSFNQAVHIAEHTMIHIEAALRTIPCHKIFIAHYEHIMSNPKAFYEPLSDFLELGMTEKKVLKSRLQDLPVGFPERKVHVVTQYKECKDRKLDRNTCYNMVLKKMTRFFRERSFMWPTFAANGYELQQ